MMPKECKLNRAGRLQQEGDWAKVSVESPADADALYRDVVARYIGEVNLGRWRVDTV